MGYLRETIKGVSWMGALRGSVRLLTILKFLILARLLAPNDFGLFGIASLSLVFLEIITETGINFFLIQKRKNFESYVDTAWVISIARGALISLVLFLVSPFVSSFFNSPESTKLLLFISLVPLIRGFINPSIVRLQKELEFSKEFGFRFFILVVDTFASIVIAAITRSAISLVYGMVLGVLLEVFLSFVVVSPKPKFVFKKAKIKEVLSHAKWINLALIFNYLFQEGDDIVVGRILSSSVLGVYQLAYKISTLPITEIADVVIKVTLPVFTKISSEKEKLKKAFWKTLAGVVLVVTPFGLLLYFFPGELVRIFLGEKWGEVVPIVKLLSFFGVLRAITACCYPLFISLKRVEYVTFTTFVGIVGLGVTVLPLVKHYGVQGAAFSALIGAILALPTSFFFVYKVLKS